MTAKGWGDLDPAARMRRFLVLSGFSISLYVVFGWVAVSSTGESLAWIGIVIALAGTILGLLRLAKHPSTTRSELLRWYGFATAALCIGVLVVFVIAALVFRA